MDGTGERIDELEDRKREMAPSEQQKKNLIFSGFIEIRLTIRNRIYFYKWFGVLI